MPLLYERWIDAITGGNLIGLKAEYAEEPEYLREYLSETIHQASRKLPCLGMNSAHLAAHAGRPDILQWIEAQAPELLDQPAGGGLLPCAQCVEQAVRVPAGCLPALERFVETLHIFGMKRLHPNLPLVLRRIAAEAWRAEQDGQTAALETCRHLLRGLLASVRETFGDDVAREAALDVSGLEPAWELLSETDPLGAHTEEWAGRALVRALENHPEPDACAFFDALPPDVGARLKQHPELLAAGWRQGDRDLTRFLLTWRPEAEREALAAALGMEDMAAVLAVLGLPEAAPSDLPFRYLLWHLALGRSVAAAARSRSQEEPRSQDDFRLYYTPRYLWNVWSDLFPGLSADEAENDLLHATCEAYKSLAQPAGTHQRDPLRGFAGQSADYPLALPFLVVSVIAASHMERGQDVTAGNYYDRLGQVLGYGLRNPPGFVPDTFRDLWEEAARWLPGPARLHLPPTGFVDIPQEHVLLRATDFERLDRYFDARRFGARVQIPPERLKDSFTTWASTHLSAAALEALGDVRGPAVLWQVSRELLRWDGSVRESLQGGATFTRAATLEPRLYPTRAGQCEVQIVAARPEGFPDTFPNVLGVTGTDLEADGVEAYYPLTASPPQVRQALARKLLEGWHVSTDWEGRRPRLQAPARTAIPFRVSEDSVALVAAPALPLRASAHLLCHESVAGAVTRYLDAACGPQGYRRSACAPLPGWVLFQDVRVADSRVQPSDPISHLRPETSVEVRFEGGLRLGRGQEWLCLAPPVLRVSGEYHRLRLNGDPVQANDAGLVRLEGRLCMPGLVVIEADGFKTQIRLEEPCRHERTLMAPPRPPVCLYPLVPGEWALLGGAPGQIVTRRVAGKDDEVMPLPFTPRWILDQAGSPKLFAACREGEGEATGEAPPEDLARWAALVRAPFMGRIQFRAGRFSDFSQSKAEAVWQDFRRQNVGGDSERAAPPAPSAPAALKERGPKKHGKKKQSRKGGKRG